MGWADAIFYIACWLVAAVIMVILCYGLDKIFPVDRDEE